MRLSDLSDTSPASLSTKAHMYACSGGIFEHRQMKVPLNRIWAPDPCEKLSWLHKAKRKGSIFFCPAPFEPTLVSVLSQSILSLHALFQWNKPRTVRRPNTRPSVLHRFITDTELAQIMPHHLRLDLNLVELLSAVHTNNRTNHLRHNDHISEVCLNEVGLLVRFGSLLRFAELLDQAHRAALEAAIEAAASAGVY